MWMGLAAAATYFLDPDRGEVRRRQVRARIEGLRTAATQAETETAV